MSLYTVIDNLGRQDVLTEVAINTAVRRGKESFSGEGR